MALPQVDIEEYIRNLERAGGQTIGPGPGAAAARQETAGREGRFVSDVATAISPPVFPDVRPQGDQTGLPAALGIVGGILPFVAPEARLIKPIAQIGREGTVARTFGPSLVGSSIGTTVGTFGEAGITGKNIFSTEFGKQVIGNLIENAAWDVGGNLAVTVGGKVLRVSKDKLGGMTDTTQDPRVAAQRFFSERAATLTRGQLTGDTTTQIIENLIKGGPSGAEAFAKQEAGIRSAINQGVQDVKNTLQTSDTFRAALASDEPLSRATGENFQALITTARDAFKDKYRPFYESLSADNGVYVSIRDVKRAAQVEYDRLKARNFAGAGKDKKEVLEDILAQEDYIDFGLAHDLRSDFSAAAANLREPGKNATTKEAYYSKYATQIERSMDKAIQLAGSTPEVLARIRARGYQPVELPGGPQASTVINEPAGFNPPVVSTPLSKNTIDEYNRIKGFYRQGMDSLYNETIVSAMQANPSKVGSILADLSESEKFSDLNKALVSVAKYADRGGAEAVKALGDIKYSFLENSLSTPEKALQFSKNLEDNPDMRRAFYKLFRTEAPKIKEILNAADIGLERASTGASYLRTRGASVAITSATGVAGYLALPEDVQTKLKENLPQAAATAGVIILTPRFLARMSTNKEAINALAGLAEASKRPKIAGATAAKIADQLNKSGIIDSEYITEINSIFNAPQQQQQPAAAPMTPQVDIEKYLQEIGQ